jgi:glycosyltransferase involved in cell wall biosynthesis
MRILFLSAFYPPRYCGGYELGCRQVVEGLKARGHSALVLTGDYGGPHPEDQARGVRRVLAYDLGPPASGYRRTARVLAKHARNRQAVRRAIREFRPDLVYAWQLGPLGLATVWEAQAAGLPVSHYVFDDELTRWRADPFVTFWSHRAGLALERGMKTLARRALLARGWTLEMTPDLAGAQFASRFLRRTVAESGNPVAEGEVIPFGIEIGDFADKPAAAAPVRLLYAGRVARQKGVHTAIEAVRLLVGELGHPEASLSIVGGTTEPDYLAALRRSVAEYRLQEKVRFLPAVAREAMPAVYRGHDALILPSIFDEPFGLVLLEAMASGLAVAATGSGGSAEILRPDNSLLFPKEDAAACARQLQRLIEDRGLYESLLRAGRRMVEREYRFGDTLDRIEASLWRRVEGSGQSPDRRSL